MTVVVLTEVLLYICFAILTGSLIIYNVPEKMLPNVVIPKKLILYSIIGITALSLGPVISIIIIFGQDIGYWISIKSVFLSFELGKAWLFMLVIALLLFGLTYFNDLKRDPLLSKIALLLVALLIGGYVKAGHAASLAPFAGFTYHFLHLLAISTWGGLLLLIAWFSKSDANWLNFTKWFTPLAVICLAVVIISGILTMTIDIANPINHSISNTANQYEQGMMSNYGQALLIKHLLVIPVVLFAAMNAFFIKRQLKQGKAIKPLKWAQVESVVILAIFCVTAFMGQQSPPHDIESLLKINGASPLFDAVYSGTITPDMTIHWALNLMSISFLVVSLLLLLITALSVVNKFAKVFSIVLSFCFVLSSYLTVMLSIQ